MVGKNEDGRSPWEISYDIRVLDQCPERADLEQEVKSRGGHGGPSGVLDPVESLGVRS